MTSPTGAHGRRVGLCAGVVTGAVSLLAPVAAGQAAAPGEVRPGDGVTLAPAPAAPGGGVRVRADRARGAGEGAVYSPAFTDTARLRTLGDRTAPWTAEAAVKPGARPGERYVLTANCGDRESLTSSFTVRAAASPAVAPAAEAPPEARSRAGVGPGRHEARRPDVTERDSRAPGSADRAPRRDGTDRTGPTRDAKPHRQRQQDEVDNAALAMGGGLATAGLAGYLLTLRRGRGRCGCQAARRGSGTDTAERHEAAGEADSFGSSWLRERGLVLGPPQTGGRGRRARRHRVLRRQRGRCACQGPRARRDPNDTAQGR
ncbi:hypothetical protein [Streptomyces oceani]|uniref:Uncharacterized protein n=1 Tax=Streptomyces oceani TaxID=1075402 RepID=A0A1E7JXJ2_9ACTN|nr:hypothetical protein [Streptomyces oceani]OEU96329.1 hypothetical protein AN216_20905 [Streptomyces oceani]